jgi:hypothetical protein
VTWVFKPGSWANSPGSLSTPQSSKMRLCGKKVFATRTIFSRLCKIFRRSRQAALDESWTVVDWDQISQTAEASVDGDFGPRAADAVHRDVHPPPHNCDRLRSEEVEIPGTFPDRAGAFTSVWSGFLAGRRVVIKSYRLDSVTDPTQARMVRFRCYLRTLCYADSPSATEVLQGSSGKLRAFPSKHRPIPGCVHHLRTPASSRVRLHGTPMSSRIPRGGYGHQESATCATSVLLPLSIF